MESPKGWNGSRGHEGGQFHQGNGAPFILKHTKREKLHKNNNTFYLYSAFQKTQTLIKIIKSVHTKSQVNQKAAATGSSTTVTRTRNWSTYHEELEICGHDAPELLKYVLLGLFVLLERTCDGFPQDDHDLQQAGHHRYVFAQRRLSLLWWF